MIHEYLQSSENYLVVSELEVYALLPDTSPTGYSYKPTTLDVTTVLQYVSSDIPVDTIEMYVVKGKLEGTVIRVSNQNLLLNTVRGVLALSKIKFGAFKNETLVGGTYSIDRGKYLFIIGFDSNTLKMLYYPPRKTLKEVQTLEYCYISLKDAYKVIRLIQPLFLPSY